MIQPRLAVSGTLFLALSGVFVTDLAQPTDPQSFASPIVFILIVLAVSFYVSSVLS